jgi:hypothetical protein
MTELNAKLSSPPLLKILPDYPNKRFAGRVNVLTDIKERFDDSDELDRIVLLYGLGAIG